MSPVPSLPHLFSAASRPSSGPVLGRRDRTGRRRQRARLLAFESLEGRVVPATITVLNTNDSGPDSLRAAIDQANLMQGPATIDFAPSVTGTITLSSALPNLSTNITVDGPRASVLTVSRSTAPGTPAFRIFNVTASAEVAISGLTITGGRADIGGGIDNSGTLTLTNSTLSDNSAGGGGGLPAGGGLYNFGTATITNSTLSGNSASSEGGGIFNAALLTVTNSTLSGNSADSGGGLYTFGAATITNSTLSGNSAGYGGGIVNSITLTVTNSTLSGNSAVFGGGLYNYFTATITNSTLSGNSASSEGGGIFNSSIDTLVTVTSSTLSGNLALLGGGIFNSGSNAPGQSNAAKLTATTSLFANPAGGNVVSEAGGVFNSLGHNLFSDTPDVALDPTDLTNTDPLLGPLADNGGPTFTQALLPGSPAIDAGAPVAGVSTDQRGISRPQGIAPDIGAFECRGFTIAVVQGDSQRASAGSAFPEPLVVRVSSPFGEPVAGGQVTFTAPPSGASAVLKTNPTTIGADGQAAVTAAANSIGGTYTVTVRAAGATDVALTLTNLSPSIAPPTVVGLQRFGFRLQPTVLVLTFSQPMDASWAEALGNYTLVAPGHGHSRVIPLVVANYNAMTRAITLVPSQLLSLHRVYQITVNGMAPLGLTNTSGVLLDGRGNGQPGSNFVAKIDRKVAVLPRSKTAKVRKGSAEGSHF